MGQEKDTPVRISLWLLICTILSKKKKKTLKSLKIFSTERILDHETKGNMINEEHHYSYIPSYWKVR